MLGPALSTQPPTLAPMVWPPPCMQTKVDIFERQQIALPAGGVQGQFVIIYTGYLSEVRWGRLQHPRHPMQAGYMGCTALECLGALLLVCVDIRLPPPAPAMHHAGEHVCV